MKQKHSSLLILSTAAANFCSSSGQISGQWVKPKYIKFHFPKKSFSVTHFPSWLIRLNGPPIAAFPTDGPCFTSFEALYISATNKTGKDCEEKWNISKKNYNQSCDV